MHKLLKRQLKKTGANVDNVDKDFLALVEQAYQDADDDRKLLEHSLEVSSLEMQELYHKLAKQAQEQLKLSEDKYNALTYELRNHYYFYSFNKSFLLTYLSDSVYNITGYSKEELIGTPFTQHLTSHPMNANLNELATKLFSGEKVAPHIINISHKDGSDLFLELSSFGVYDDNKHLTNVSGIARDITQEYIAQQKLHHLSNHDALTGISNRHSLYNQLEYIIVDSKRNKKNFSLLFIDLDGFKAVNDTYGHKTGDILLQKVTQRIQKQIRQSDLLARIGGDEFIVVLTDVDKEFISKISQEILQNLEKTFLIQENTLNISASIGIATYPKDGENNDALLNNADKAMYTIKNSGKNNFIHC